MSVEDQTEQESSTSAFWPTTPTDITAPIDISAPADEASTSFYPTVVSFWPSTLSEVTSFTEVATPQDAVTLPDVETQPDVATPRTYPTVAPEVPVATYYPTTPQDADTLPDVKTRPDVATPSTYPTVAPEVPVATYAATSDARDSASTIDSDAISTNRDPLVVRSSATVGIASATAAIELPIPAVYLDARDLELKTRRGTVFSGVNLQASLGQVVAVRGCNGSGKTSLLLVLSGRMKSTGGTLRVGQFQLPKQRVQIERQVGLSFIKGLNDLQDGLTAAFAVSAEFELYGRKPQREEVEKYLREWGLRDEANIRAKDLSAKKLAQLGIALAFVGRPHVVVVDDIENQLTKSQSEDLIGLLSRAARKYNAAVVVGVVERDLAALADSCIYLAKEGEWLPWHSKD